jgi:hypothetical protein
MRVRTRDYNYMIMNLLAASEIYGFEFIRTFLTYVKWKSTFSIFQMYFKYAHSLI